MKYELSNMNYQISNIKYQIWNMKYELQILNTNFYNISLYTIIYSKYNKYI
jgi:hypothetical protein